MKQDCDLLKLYALNHSTHEPWHSIFITIYSIFTLTAFVLNILIFSAILYRYTNTRKRYKNNGNIPRQENVRCKPKESECIRDILIAHLAIFDIFLSFTMPWTAADALTKFWPLSNTFEVGCQLVKTVPAVIVYSTSIIIIVIAIHCYRQIVCAAEQQITAKGIAYLSPSVVSLALLMSSPIFMHTKLESGVAVTQNITHPSDDERTKLDSLGTHLSSTMGFSHAIPTTEKQPLDMMKFSQRDSNRVGDASKCEESDHDLDWSNVMMCFEDWNFGDENDFDPRNRLYYSIFSIMVQLVIPFITISTLYFLVYLRLRQQSQFQQNTNSWSARKRSVAIIREHRTRRRNILLATIPVVYLVSWLPLSLVGIIFDADPSLFDRQSDLMINIYLASHLFSMTSACINPIIYGYCNENISKGKNRDHFHTLNFTQFIFVHWF